MLHMMEKYHLNRIHVVSSNLNSVGYDPSTRTLEIEFREGDVYVYNNVPQHIYDGLMSASSKGSYHHSHIKNSYSYRKIR